MGIDDRKGESEDDEKIRNQKAKEQVMKLEEDAEEKAVVLEMEEKKNHRQRGDAPIKALRVIGNSSS